MSLLQLSSLMLLHFGNPVHWLPGNLCAPSLLFRRPPPQPNDPPYLFSFPLTFSFNRIGWNYIKMRSTVYGLWSSNVVST